MFLLCKVIETCCNHPKTDRSPTNWRMEKNNLQQKHQQQLTTEILSNDRLSLQKKKQSAKMELRVHRMRLRENVNLEVVWPLCQKWWKPVQLLRWMKNWKTTKVCNGQNSREKNSSPNQSRISATERLFCNRLKVSNWINW